MKFKLDMENEQVVKDLLDKTAADVTDMIKRHLDLMRDYLPNDARPAAVKAVAIAAGCAAIAALTAMMSIETDMEGDPTPAMIIGAALLIARHGSPDSPEGAGPAAAEDLAALLKAGRLTE